MVERRLPDSNKTTMQSLMLVVLLHEWVLSDVAFMSGFSL